MATSFPLAAMLAVACSFVALLPTSAAPMMAHEMGPHDVTEDSQMATTEVISDQEIEKLQETFVEYIIDLAKERASQLAVETTPKPPVLMDIESNIYRRFLRSADSTPGYSANPPEVHATNLSLDHTAEFTGYSAKDAVPSHYGADPHGIAKYAPAHYVPPSARSLTRNLAHAKATSLAPSLTSVPTPTLAYTPAPTLAHTPTYAPAPTLAQTPVVATSSTPAHTAGSSEAPALEHTPVSAPAPALAPTPIFAPSSEAENPKSIMDMWNQFLTEPLQEHYDKFVAYLPAKSIQSLLLGHQYFDFKSVQDYRASKEGFVSAMQEVYEVPNEQLGEVENFFDMMTKVLPSKFFGKERSVADLFRQIRFYFATKNPSVKVIVPETVARYNLK